jgi:hypothetical protein
VGQESYEAWEVFDYERKMFAAMHSLWTTDHYRNFDPLIANAIFESLLLHIRNLCDILLAPRPRADDVTIKALLPNFRSTTLNELDLLYGRSDEDGTPCRQINKMLAHPTTVRGRDTDHSIWLNPLSRCLFSLLDQIEDAR